MKYSRDDLIVWAPRIVGLGLAIFLSLFALDAFSEGRGLIGAVVAFVMGLVPSLVVLATVIVGWKHERIAAVVFAILTVFYAIMARDHLAWIAVIAGPLALVGLLFYVSWRARHSRAPALPDIHG